MNRESRDRKGFPLPAKFGLMRYLASLIIAGCVAIAAQAQERIVMACTADDLIIGEEQTVDIHAWVTPEDLVGRQMRWSEPTAGAITQNRMHTLWDLSAAESGAYGVTAVLYEGDTVVNSCTVSVIVEIGFESRGPNLTTGRNFLVSGSDDRPNDEAGYGLYSYLVIPRVPSDSESSRYINVISNFLRKGPDVLELENYAVPRSELNIAYVPVRRMPDSEFSEHIAQGDYLSASAWVLSNYDYARASIIVGNTSNQSSAGPLIVSYSQPLTAARSIDSRQLIVQDYSTVPENIVPSMIQRFFDRAGQTSWSNSKVEDFAYELVTIFSVLAEGVIGGRAAVNGWISWGASVPIE